MSVPSTFVETLGVRLTLEDMSNIQEIEFPLSVSTTSTNDF